MNTERLFDLMKEYFGAQGIFLLRGVMEGLGLGKLSELNDLEKERLLKALMSEIFSGVLSGEKRMVVKSHLISILEFSERATEKMEKIAEDDYMRMS